MRKGKHAVLGLAALISAAAIGGTWASWTQELKAGNEFMTGSYNTSLDETFESPKNWKPGEKQRKQCRSRIKALWTPWQRLSSVRAGSPFL